MIKDTTMNKTTDKNDSMIEINGGTEDAPNLIPNLLQLEKMQKLMIEGYSREEVEKMCEPKPVDLEAVMEEIMVWQEKELRRLAKRNQKPKKCAKKSKLEEIDGLPVIHFRPVDLREDRRTGLD